MSVADAPEQGILNYLETVTVVRVTFRLVGRSFAKAAVAMQEFNSAYKTAIPAVWPCGRYEALNE